jgi:hypothetical protein
MEVFLMVLTAISAFASAIAAVAAWKTSVQSLRLQKNIATGRLQKLTSISDKMGKLKGFLNNLPGINDEQFGAIEPLYLEIKSDLQTLVESGILKEKPGFFSAPSFGGAYACGDGINHEIVRIEKAISKM